jgi:hypothetical protein
MNEKEQSLMPTLAFFIATQDQLCANLKKEITSFNSMAEDIMIEVIMKCVELVEKDDGIDPHLKHVYIRVNYVVT